MRRAENYKNLRGWGTNNTHLTYQYVYKLLFWSQIDSHLACAPSGFIPDARTLVDYARIES